MYLNHKVKNVFLNFFNGVIVVLALSPTAFCKETIGWVENVGVTMANNIVKAKIDTGADSSSLNCHCITPYERDGVSWVKFSITDINGKTISYDKKITANVKVKRHFGDVQKRYAVRMGFCIGSQYGETDVSLVDRTGFNYDLLIGRKFLQDRFIVDPAKIFITEPSCNVD
jgi:hypothetical protein